MYSSTWELQFSTLTWLIVNMPHSRRIRSGTPNLLQIGVTFDRRRRRYAKSLVAGLAWWKAHLQSGTGAAAFLVHRSSLYRNFFHIPGKVYPPSPFTPKWWSKTKWRRQCLCTQREGVGGRERERERKRAYIPKVAWRNFPTVSPFASMLLWVS